jgi:repressor LexA
MKLTRRQQEIYQTLRDSQERFEHPPTYDELCQLLGLSSRGSLHKHIQALIQAGLVEPIEGLQRGIRLTENQQSLPAMESERGGR